MAWRTLLLIVAMLTVAMPARAGLPQSALDNVEFAPAPGAKLPLDAPLSDDDAAITLGEILDRHPTSLLVFADYTCQSVCGAELAIAASSLSNPAMKRIDAGLVVIGLDPKDNSSAASNMREEIIGAGSPLAANAAFLNASEEAVSRLTQAAGYRYRYDAETDQFAHPAAALTVSRDGRIGRPLAALSLMPDTLRRALIEIGDGETGGLIERIVLRCYAFDPVTGLYTADIKLVLRLAGLATVVLLAVLVLALLYKTDRRRGAA